MNAPVWVIAILSTQPLRVLTVLELICALPNRIMYYPLRIKHNLLYYDLYLT